MTGSARRAGMRTPRPVSLVTYLPRVGRWSTLPGAAAVAAAILLIAAQTDGWGGGPPLSELRLGAVALAATLAFALDDPAADTLAASPTPLRSRRLWSLVLAVGALGALWAGLLGLSGALLPAVADACLAVVRAPLTLELGLLGVTGVALGTVATRRLGGGAGGIVAGPGVVLVFFALVAVLGWLPGSPLDPAWSELHRRMLLSALVLTLVVVWATRDLWQRRFSLAGWPTAVLSVAVVGALAVPLWPTTPTGVADRLDATLADVVGAQGITALTATVEGPGFTWARTVGDDGTIRSGAPSALATRRPLGGLSVAEVGTGSVTSGGGFLEGAASATELHGWTRTLAGRPGDLAERLAAFPPPGSAWVPPSEPHAPPPPPTALTEVRWLAASDTVVTVTTGGGALPPCGLSAADALMLSYTD